jgi:hypothetical protein
MYIQNTGDVWPHGIWGNPQVYPNYQTTFSYTLPLVTREEFNEMKATLDKILALLVTEAPESKADILRRVSKQKVYDGHSK